MNCLQTLDRGALVQGQVDSNVSLDPGDFYGCNPGDALLGGNAAFIEDYVASMPSSEAGTDAELAPGPRPIPYEVELLMTQLQTEAALTTQAREQEELAALLESYGIEDEPDCVEPEADPLADLLEPSTQPIWAQEPEDWPPEPTVVEPTCTEEVAPEDPRDAWLAGPQSPAYNRWLARDLIGETDVDPYRHPQLGETGAEQIMAQFAAVTLQGGKGTLAAYGSFGVAEQLAEHAAEVANSPETKLTPPWKKFGPKAPKAGAPTVMRGLGGLSSAHATLSNGMDIVENGATASNVVGLGGGLLGLCAAATGNPICAGGAALGWLGSMILPGHDEPEPPAPSREILRAPLPEQPPPAPDPALARPARPAELLAHPYSVLTDDQAFAQEVAEGMAQCEHSAPYSLEPKDCSEAAIAQQETCEAVYDVRAVMNANAIDCAVPPLWTPTSEESRQEAIEYGLIEMLRVNDAFVNDPACALNADEIRFVEEQLSAKDEGAPVCEAPPVSSLR